MASEESEGLLYWRPMHWYFMGDWQEAVRLLWPCLYISARLSVVAAIPSDPLAGRKRLIVNMRHNDHDLDRSYQFCVDGEATPWLAGDVLQDYAVIQWPEYFKVVRDGKV